MFLWFYDGNEVERVYEDDSLISKLGYGVYNLNVKNYYYIKIGFLKLMI